MIFYEMGEEVEASSTNIGEEQLLTGVVTPEFQAHSVKVAMIPEEQSLTYGVDALVTATPGIRIGVRTADCVPVLLYDPHCRVAAAVHSGWKGTVRNIVGHTISYMEERLGCNARNMRAVVGPCIHVEAFEVGDEVYEAFNREGYASFCHRMPGPDADATIGVVNSEGQVKWHIDLPAICGHQLQACGVGNVYISPLCTYRNHERLYSFRHSHSSDSTHRIITSILIK